MKRIVIVLLGVLICAGGAVAHPHSPRRAVEMQLLVDGHVIGGTSGPTTWVPVKELGCEYVVRIRNHLSIPVEAVVSVDGLSVINGRHASDAIRGYLVQPRATVDIPGWRRGSGSVAAFTFSREEDSYAYRTGRPDGIGMVRVAAFEQARPKLAAARDFAGNKKMFRESRPPSGTQPTQSVESQSYSRRGFDVARIGTGYGRELTHRVSRVPFQRSHRVHRLTIHYGSPRRRVPVENDFTPPPPAR